MKPEQEIEAKLQELLKDERFYYPPALVMINAPLALIQVDLKARINILEWILGKPLSSGGPKPKNRRKP